MKLKVYERNTADILKEEERIAYFEGFKRPSQQKTNEELGERTRAVIAASSGESASA